MMQVPITNLPNQSLSINLDQSQYDIRLHSNQDGSLTYIDIIRDNVTILSGQRAVAGFPIIPYPYLEDGNFVILTNDDDYPEYSQFGITQFMIFASQTELDAIRG